MNQILPFYSGATAVDNTGVVKTLGRYHENGTFQIGITGTATVTLEGRLDDAAPWKLIGTYTTSDVIALALLPQFRVKITAYTSGTVGVWLAE